jgi:hypothetical protein
MWSLNPRTHKFKTFKNWKIEQLLIRNLLAYIILSNILGLIKAKEDQVELWMQQAWRKQDTHKNVDEDISRKNFAYKFYVFMER